MWQVKWMKGQGISEGFEHASDVDRMDACLDLHHLVAGSSYHGQSALGPPPPVQVLKRIMFSLMTSRSKIFTLCFGVMKYLFFNDLSFQNHDLLLWSNEVTRFSLICHVKLIAF